MTGPGYEFSDEQGATIGRLAGRMDVVGKVLVALAVLSLLSAFFGADPEERVGDLITGVLVGLVGWWTVRAARSFREVATTEGHDIPHLMNALGELHKLYTLQFWVFVALGILLAVALLLVLLGGGAP